MILKKHIILTCEWKFRHEIPLFGTKDLINNLGNVDLKNISKDKFLSVVSKAKSLGRVLSLSIVLHCWVTNSLYKFAFSKNWVTSWSLTKIGGIKGIFLLLTNDFRMDLSALGAELGSLSLEAIRLWHADFEFVIAFV